MTSPPRAPSRWRSCSSTAWTRASKGCEASTFAHTARGVAAFDLATFRLIFPIFCRFSRSADMDLYFFSSMSSGLAQSPSRRRRPEPYQYAKGEVTWGYPQRSNAAQTG